MRCWWPAEHLDAKVVTFPQLMQVGEVPMDFDVYVFQKHGHPDAQRQLLDAGKQVWLDHCDPMWWFSPNQMNEIVKHSTGAVFSSRNLQADFKEWHKEAGYRTETIPDRLRKEHFTIKRNHAPTVPVRFIWFGMHVNRLTIPGGMTNVLRLKSHGVNVELTIMDDTPHIVEEKYDIPIYHTPFNLQNEVSVLAAHDIALLPPYPGPWGKVKSDNKSRTASACGLPVTDGFDFEELKKLALDPKHREASVKEYKDPWVERSAKDWERLVKDA
jgi:hypothetical protein